MGFGNREIELKLVARDQKDLTQVANIIESSIKSKKIIKGFSKDVYWKAPRGKSDFIRVRYLEEGNAQVTLKRVDKNDNFDRVEIDLEASDPDQAATLLKSLLGEPLGTVRKVYKVFWTDKKDTTISVYKVNGDRRIFVEIEARSKKKVEKVKKTLEKKTVLKLDRINKSLFQLFVVGKRGRK